MVHLPLDLVLLILTSLPSLQLVKIIKKLNNINLNYYFTDILALPRLINLPIGHDYRYDFYDFINMVSHGTNNLTNLIGFYSRVYNGRGTSPRQFKRQLQAMKLKDGDIISIPYYSNADYKITYFYYKNGDMIKIRSRAPYAHDQNLIQQYSLPAEALDLLKKYDVSTSTDLKDLYPWFNFTAYCVKITSVPESLIIFCQHSLIETSRSRLELEMTVFGILPIVLGNKTDPIFYVTNHYFHIKTCQN